jgi:hypothetical protein
MNTGQLVKTFFFSYTMNTGQLVKSWLNSNNIPKFIQNCKLLQITTAITQMEPKLVGWVRVRVRVRVISHYCV